MLSVTAALPVVGEYEDMPRCVGCHGSHEVLPSTNRESMTHPVNLPVTCGRCHEDLDITRKYSILIDRPIEIYGASGRGLRTKAATAG